jgi:hypothetical protein
MLLDSPRRWHMDMGMVGCVYERRKYVFSENAFCGTIQNMEGNQYTTRQLSVIQGMFTWYGFGRV